MGRKILGAPLNKGDEYSFTAADPHTSGKLNVAFDGAGGQHQQASLVITKENGSQVRKDKLTPGANNFVTVGPIQDMLTIQNLGPATVQLSLSY
jgi:hypothetical protein